MALEPERRSCIYHAYVNGYTQNEISELLGDTHIRAIQLQVNRVTEV